MKMPTWPKVRWRIFANRYSLWDALCLPFFLRHLFQGHWTHAIAWLLIWLIVMAIIERPWRPLFARPFDPDSPKPEA